MASTRYPSFEGLPLIYSISTVADGNLSFKWGEEEKVRKNRRTFVEGAGIKFEDCVVMGCLHDAALACVTTEDRGKGAMVGEESLPVDALITDTPGLPLFLLVADCIPAILYDPQKKVLALVHLSWKTTEAKLAQKVVEKMQQEYGSDPKNIMVGLGPSIRKESYKFMNTLQESLPGWEPFLQHLPTSETAIDVVGYTCHQLGEKGVEKNNIEVIDVDTATSPEFFSHYRSVKTGEPEARFATVVMMQDTATPAAV